MKLVYIKTKKANSAGHRSTMTKVVTIWVLPTTTICKYQQLMIKLFGMSNICC